MSSDPNTMDHHTNAKYIALFLSAALTGSQALAQTVACGGYHSLVLCTDGTVMAWGENSHGCVATGDFTTPVLDPVVAQTATIGTITALAAGTSTSYAVNSAGQVWSWGLSNYGQLGNGGTAQQPLPVQVAPFTGTAIAIAAGNFHAVALKDDGTLWAWGWNYYGSVGDGTYDQRTSPVAVSNTYGGDIAAVSCGSLHSLALKGDSSVWAWGRNEYGQVGISGWTSLVSPVQVNTMSEGVIAVAAGHVHSLALQSDGTVWGWGRNESGQLGNGNNDNTAIPVQASGLSDVVRIACMGNTSMAVKADGTLWAWGTNAFGQMTDEYDVSGSNVPVQITGFGSDPIIFHSDGDHTMLIDATGLWSWGADNYGAVGDGVIEPGTCTCQPDPVLLTSVCAVSTAVEEEEHAVEAPLIYPIPCSDAFSIDPGTSDPIDIKLFDTDGRLCLSQRSAGICKVMTDQLANGVYQVRLERNGYPLHAGRVIVAR